MQMKTLVGGLAALLVLSACATATPYQPASDSLTDRRTVETYLLFRAAELTLQSGFDHFSVLDRQTEADKRLIATGFNDGFGHGFSPYYSHFHPRYSFYGPRGRRFTPAFHRGRYYYPSRFSYGHHYDPFWGEPREYRQVIRYDAGAEVIMGRGPKPNDPAYFDARDVMNNLGPTIQRPEPR